MKGLGEQVPQLYLAARAVLLLMSAAVAAICVARNEGKHAGEAVSGSGQRTEGRGTYIKGLASKETDATRAPQHDICRLQ
jgi:hypothetical protein